MGYLAPGNMGALAFLGGLTIFIGKDMKPDSEPTEPEEEGAP